MALEIHSPNFVHKKIPQIFFFFFKVSSPSSDFWVQNYSQTHHETYERIHQKWSSYPHFYLQCPLIHPPNFPIVLGWNSKHWCLLRLYWLPLTLLWSSTCCCQCWPRQSWPVRRTKDAFDATWKSVLSKFTKDDFVVRILTWDIPAYP